MIPATLALAAAAGCGKPRERKPPDPPTVMLAPLGALRGSALPHLRADGGGVVLSWTEPAADGAHALRWARLGPRGWSSPHTVTQGRDWLLNWADFPSVTALGGSRMLAHWLTELPGGGYGISLVASADGGSTWSAPWSPHRDGTATEHGFVSVVPRGAGGAVLVWLDGRAFDGLDGATAEQRAAMALRATSLDVAALDAAAAVSEGGAAGAPGEAAAAPGDGELEVDPRTCSCCQTAAVAVGEDVVVAYRDRDVNEIRDISVVRLESSGWTQPHAAHRDGWRIEGCPVNGPALAADGSRVALAWFTEADDRAAVKLALSEDGGRTFGAPVRIDEGAPQGRVGVALVGARAAVSWQERNGQRVELRLRVVQAGKLGPARVIASLPMGRLSGFPQLARFGEELVLAWTAGDERGQTQVQTARLPLE
ncbi:MAG: hypothetical protein R3B48_14430 [Kofleriaceae bacterium]